jgi:hypothetical protein
VDQEVAAQFEAKVDRSGEHHLWLGAHKPGQWYRHHPLFREFLLGELRRIEPGIVSSLHQRAADWYQANGSPALALEHLLQTTDWDRSLRLKRPKCSASLGPRDTRWSPAVHCRVCGSVDASWYQDVLWTNYSTVTAPTCDDG